MTEFANLGAHCHYDLCHQQTYLPFKCDHCNHEFCRFHRTQETHECSELAKSLKNNNNDNNDMESKSNDNNDNNNNNKSKNSGGFLKPFKCSKKGCKKREWTEIMCDECHKNYCIKHRSEDSHKCKSVINKSINNGNNNNNNNNGNINEIGMRRNNLINSVLNTMKQITDSNNNNDNDNNASSLKKNPSILVK